MYFLHTVVNNCLNHDKPPINTFTKKYLRYINEMTAIDMKYIVHITVTLRIYGLNSVCNKNWAFNIFMYSGNINVSALSEFIQKLVPAPTIISDVKYPLIILKYANNSNGICIYIPEKCICITYNLKPQ